MREVLPALTRARAAWGDPLPDWIEALAKACDQSSQARVAGAIHYSPATLSYVLKNRYAGDLKKVEQAARGALMHKMVQCPVVGPLGADACLAHQRAPFSTRNPQRVAFYRACRSGCVNSRLASHDGDPVLRSSRIET